MPQALVSNQDICYKLLFIHKIMLCGRYLKRNEDTPQVALPFDVSMHSVFPKGNFRKFWIDSKSDIMTVFVCYFSRPENSN